MNQPVEQFALTASADPRHDTTPGRTCPPTAQIRRTDAAARGFVVVSFRHRNAGRIPLPRARSARNGVPAGRSANTATTYASTTARLGKQSGIERVDQRATYVAHAPDTRCLVLVRFPQAERECV